VVAGAIPWWLTRWEGREAPYWIPLRVFGVFLIAGGMMTIVPAFLRFVVEGLGTPAPIAPTERLVVGGLYRYVRNPMYVAVTAIILGQGLLLGRAVLFVYAATIYAAFASFVHWYEEPALTRRFGRQYAAYKDAVPAWCPSPRLLMRRRTTD